MRTKRYISLLLLTVYLLTACGSAISSLTCDCVTMHAHTRSAHTGGVCAHCSHHAEHAGDTPEADTFLNAPCCGDRHSTDIELYTGTDSGSERETVRCTFVMLLPAQAAECPCPAHVPALRQRPVIPAEPLVAAVWLPAAGFRAPPASV